MSYRDLNIHIICMCTCIAHVGQIGEGECVRKMNVL